MTLRIPVSELGLLGKNKQSAKVVIRIMAGHCYSKARGKVTENPVTACSPVYHIRTFSYA
jgi:hypothetical protein